jgi:hypothetical protein
MHPSSNPPTVKLAEDELTEIFSLVAEADPPMLKLGEGGAVGMGSRTAVAPYYVAEG